MEPFRYKTSPYPYASLGVGEYFWFDPESQEFVGHRLVSGEYERISPNDRGHLWSETLELWLGRHNRQLRYFLPTGELVLTLEEENGTGSKQNDQTNLVRNCRGVNSVIAIIDLMEPTNKRNYVRPLPGF